MEEIYLLLVPRILFLLRWALIDTLSSYCPTLGHLPEKKKQILEPSFGKYLGLFGIYFDH